MEDSDVQIDHHWTVCSASCGGNLETVIITRVPVPLVFRRPRPTCLETRTKECNMCTSPLVRKPQGAMKVKAQSSC